jgi:hypothetical protein
MRPGSWVKRLGVSTVWALGVALCSAPRAAAATNDAAAQRVAIQIPERHDALLDEALVRIQGELGAMGLEPVVRAAESGANEPATTPASADIGGTLVLERAANWIRIRATGPASLDPVVQEIDTRPVDVNAEVIAVRAVEALRAVMLGLPEPKRAEPERKPAASAPASAALKPPPAPPSTPPAALSIAPATRGALTFWAAPGTFLDRGLRTPSLGAELGAFWGRSSVFVGVTGSAALLRASFKSSPGEVEVRRETGLARLGYALELGHAFECWMLAGAGVSRYGIAGHAEAGYIGEQSHHTSMLVALGAGAMAWLSPHVGTFLRVDGSLATNAPAIHVDYRELVTLDRPTLWLSLGLALRATKIGP